MASISELLGTTDLPSLVKEYCEVQHDDDSELVSTGLSKAKVGLLSRILLLVNSYESYAALVKQHMASYMTSHNPEVRVRAVELLAELLRRLPAIKFNPAGVDTMLNFFLSRYGTDYESAGPCLDAIYAILDHQEGVIQFAPATTTQDDPKQTNSVAVNLGAILRGLCKPYDVTAMMQHLRFKIFEIFVLILERPKYLEAAKGEIDSRIILVNFIEAMDGEKDPRCLLLCLRAATLMLQSFPDNVVADAADAMFDVTSVYFPIMFRPPPNDPYGITTKDLVDSLDAVFSSTPHLATHVIPMLLEKLRLTSTEVVQAKIDSLHTLVSCVSHYGARYISPFLENLAESMLLQMYSGDDAQVEKDSLIAIQSIAQELANASSASLKVQTGVTSSPSTDADDVVVKLEEENKANTATGEQQLDDNSNRASVGNGSRTSAWNTFVGYLVKECQGSIKQSIDSMVGRASARILVAIAKSSALGLSDVLHIAFPLVLRWTDKEHLGVSPQQRIAALDFLQNLLEAIDPVVDYPAACHPVRPQVPQLLNLLNKELRTGEGTKVDGANDEGNKRLVVGSSPQERCGAIQCVGALIVSPPSPLVTLDQVVEVVELLTQNLVHANESEDVQQTSLEVLSAIGLKRVEYGDVLLQHTIPLVMSSVESAETGTNLDRVLKQAAKLSKIDAVFDAVLPKLLEKILVVDQDGSKAFVTDTKVCECVLQTISNTLIQNRESVETIDRCCLLTPSESSTPSVLLVPWLLSALKAKSASDEIVNVYSQHIVSIFRTLAQNCSPERESDLLKVCVESLMPEHKADLHFDALVSPIAAVVCSARRDAEFTRLDELVQVFAMIGSSPDGSHSSATITSARHSLASLLNKMGDKSKLDEIVKKILGEFLPPIPTMNEVPGLIACICNKSAELSNRKAAMETFLWMAKGLVMRLSPVLSDIAATMLCMMEPDSPVDNLSLRRLLAKGFGVISRANPDVLNQACRARENFLFRQRFLTCTLNPLIEGLKSTDNADMQHSYLLAIASLLEPMPRAVVLDNMATILPLMIQALGAGDVAARVAALYTFSVILRESPGTVVVHLATVIPLLLDLTVYQEGVRAVDRVEALECIGELAELQYHQIHPYRTLVSRRLAAALDDRKRVVRKVAVQCRNTWLTITM